MKVLKGRLHIVFGDLAVGETFLHGDEKPLMKVRQSVGCKLEEPPHNAVALESGILFVFKDGDRIMKVELGITGLEGSEDA